MTSLKKVILYPLIVYHLTIIVYNLTSTSVSLSVSYPLMVNGQYKLFPVGRAPPWLVPLFRLHPVCVLRESLTSPLPLPHSWTCQNLHIVPLFLEMQEHK